MRSLDEDYLLTKSISIEMSGSLRKLGNYQGKQELLLQRRPQLLQSLRDAAIIQSSESSNRIEGIIVSKERLHAVLEEKAKPKSRSEAEVLGYRNMLAEIHNNHTQLEISADVILRMHKHIYQYTDTSGGAWKSKDNVIEKRLSDGRWITRFVPTKAIETPFYMRELCERFQRLWKQNKIDKLLLSFAFVFDFLCIHPFADGNGRISRLLTVLLLHKIDFDVMRYISFERMIEDTKESYYEILQKCSQQWHESHHHLTPWFEYHISLLLASYSQLEERVSVIDAGRGEKTAWVLEMIEQLPQTFSVGDLVRICPGVSRPMIRHVLEKLRTENKLELSGAGRGAKWCKIG